MEMTGCVCPPFLGGGDPYENEWEVAIMRSGIDGEVAL